MFRLISKQIEQTISFPHHRIVLILGLRQTGKTTLAKTVCQGKKYQIYNFDIPRDRIDFDNPSRHSLDEFAKANQDNIIVIDEVQRMPEATSIIKHLFDHYHLRFILTGSSELKIRKNFGDSLAGRTRNFHLYPLSIKEILVQKGVIKENEDSFFNPAQNILQRYLVFGSLPEIENMPTDQYYSFLTGFTDSLLSKDILMIENLRKSTKVYAVAKFLALQIGQLVNVNELAILSELTRASIYRYLDILEQMNIIIRAYPLSTNNRQAISEKFKVYFTDLGVRNALINNFDALVSRLDQGQLLENAVYLGIKRQMDYANKIYQLGFFRSRLGTEIDIVLKVDKQEKLYEVKISRKFARKKSHVSYITMENAWEYLK